MRIVLILLFHFLFLESCVSVFIDALSKEKPKYLFGFMDTSGKITIPQIYEGVGRFSQGLAPVKKDGLWGYINPKGEVIISFQFKSAKPFSDDPILAPAEKNDVGEKAWGYIDTKGNWVVQPSFYNATEFKNGVAEVATEKFKYKNVSKRYDKYFLTKSGKYIYHNGLYSYYSGPGQYSEGLMPSCKEGKWGFKDINDKWIIDPKYTIVGNFENGLARVQITNPNPYKDCELISEDEPYGLWGYIDKTGKEVIPIKFRSASNFSKDGLALVDEEFQTKTFQTSKTFSKYYINREGTRAIDLNFKKAEAFTDYSFALVRADEKNILKIEPNKSAFMDKTGNKIKFTLKENEEIFNLRSGTKEFFRITLQVKPDANKYEHIYVSRYYRTSDLSQAIPKDFPPCFGGFVNPPNCMTDDFHEGLAWVAKAVSVTNSAETTSALGSYKAQ
ncbi:MAG: WG repeat-containing protein [Leptospiraceae bacterium]|nr:WG repeat-containing protein [Leptospiraceae bacterium]